MTHQLFQTTLKQKHSAYVGWCNGEVEGLLKGEAIWWVKEEQNLPVPRIEQFEEPQGKCESSKLGLSFGCFSPTLTHQFLCTAPLHCLITLSSFWLLLQLPGFYNLPPLRMCAYICFTLLLASFLRGKILLGLYWFLLLSRVLMAAPQCLYTFAFLSLTVR